MPRGTPAALKARAASSAGVQDRLDRIMLCANPMYLIRLAERSRAYRDLIRRYSNDSMF